MKVELKLGEKNINFWRVLIGLFLITIFVYLFKLNTFAPYVADDYSLGSSTIDVKGITAIKKIFEHQVSSYFGWSGRVISLSTVHLFLWIGKDYFNLFNVLFFIALIVLISQYSKLRKFDNKEDLFVIFMTFAFCWFCLPTLGETFFWVTGSINYLWPTVVVLLFLLPYRYLYENKILIKDNKRSMIVMFILGIFAGGCHENSAIITVFFVGITFLYCIVKKYGFTRWFYSGGAGAISGFIFLISAPGSQERAKILIRLAGGNPSLKTKVRYFMHGLKYFATNHVEMTFLFFLCFLLLIWLVINLLKKRNRASVFLIALFIITGLVSWISMVMIHYFPTFALRAAFAGGVFIIIAATTVITKFNKLFYISLIVSLFLFVSMSKVFDQYKLIHLQMNERLSIIAKSKKNGDLDVKVPRLTVKPSAHIGISNEIEDVKINPDFWVNADWARYYGLNSIRLDDSIMKIELENFVKDDYCLFYDIGRGMRDEHVSCYPMNDSAKRTLYFSIPHRKALKYRFDPGTRPNQEIRIKSITIELKDNKFHYEGNDLFNKLKPLHDIKSLEIQENIVVVKSSGTDPQIDFMVP